MRFVVLMGLILAGCTGTGCTGNGAKTNSQQSGGGSVGKVLFTQNCATCHGETGQGDGPASVYLFPKPRNFTTGSFKLRSTPTGQLPTDDDLLKTITNGIPGSAMPSFSFLSEDERKELVKYVKELTVKEFPADDEDFIEEVKSAGAVVKQDAEHVTVNLFAWRKPSRIITVGNPPGATRELLQKGREVYFSKNVSCFNCHGESGRGDGPSAPDLLDDLGYPIPPADFTAGIFKGGGDVKDIYLRFTTGMMGTPMPSFENTLSEEERWAIAYYVKSLTRKKPVTYFSGRKIVSRAVSKELPLNADDPVYSTPATQVPLMPLWQRKEFTQVMNVRSVHNEKNIAIIYEWEDATVNGSFLRIQDFADAVAIMMPLNGKEIPITMGDKDNPVNIWHWRFDFQLDQVSFKDMEDAYPSMVVDDYAYEGLHYPKGTEKPGHLPITSAPSHDPTYLTGYGVHNPMSDQHRTSPCVSMYAAGFGTLTPIPQKEQTVVGYGIWRGGKWTVLMVRPMQTGNKNEVQLKPGVTWPVYFAVWDGEKSDRDGQKLVSPCQELVIEK